MSRISHDHALVDLCCFFQVGYGLFMTSTGDKVHTGGEAKAGSGSGSVDRGEDQGHETGAAGVG
jgi:hypothetical protein